MVQPRRCASFLSPQRAHHLRPLLLVVCLRWQTSWGRQLEEIVRQQSEVKDEPMNFIDAHIAMQTLVGDAVEEVNARANLLLRCVTALGANLFLNVRPEPVDVLYLTELSLTIGRR